ncbi:hypothetical protein ACT3QO_01940 [Psychrobacter sp. AOP7-D1-15]|uniref:hypothetical protein n=1 Tax=unclassified Psychrobacter TaxID=196806 RepID=UPI001D015CC3|nr:hypothetical protein [Psychrobacter sp. FME61]
MSIMAVPDAGILFRTPPHLVSAAGQSQSGWEFEMINRLKKDASEFKKRPIREHLDY